MRSGRPWQITRQQGIGTHLAYNHANNATAMGDRSASCTSGGEGGGASAVRLLSGRPAAAPSSRIRTHRTPHDPEEPLVRHSQPSIVDTGCAC